MVYFFFRTVPKRITAPFFSLIANVIPFHPQSTSMHRVWRHIVHAGMVTRVELFKKHKHSLSNIDCAVVLLLIFLLLRDTGIC